MGIITKALIKVLPSKYSKLIIDYKINKEAFAWYKNQAILEKCWKEDKNFIPPPHIAKQEMILKYTRKYNLSVLVETGTYLAFMIDAMKNNFQELYSIELSKVLYERAKKKFENFPHIHFIQGDSGKKLTELLNSLNKPCLFWLDGHYSGGVTSKAKIETPIISELKAILDHHIKEHVILIDDARLFNGTNDYPTIDYIETFLRKTSNKFQLNIEQDIIVIVQEFNKS